MASERDFITENIRRIILKEYIRKETERAGFGGLDIQRTPMGTRITLTAERPGMIIGRKGSNIKELTSYIESEFSFENPRIDVQDDPEPSLNPHIMAQKLASALERGWHFRRAGHSTVRRIMEAGARGCQVIISGKLTGERHRTEKFRQGHIKYCGEPRKIWMKEGFAIAKKKPGVIGVKVQIMDKNARLPDEVKIMSLEEKLKAEGEEVPVEGEGDEDEKDEKDEKKDKKKEEKPSKPAKPDKPAKEEKKEEKPAKDEKKEEKPAKDEKKEEKPAKPAKPDKPAKEEKKEEKPSKPAKPDKPAKEEKKEEKPAKDEKKDKKKEEKPSKPSKPEKPAKEGKDDDKSDDEKEKIDDMLDELESDMKG